MKKLVLFLLLSTAASVLSPVKLSAQDCYNSTRQQGISCYNDGDYSIAIDCFEAAKLCPDRPAEDDLDTWISKCRTKIKEASEAAERAAAEAEARRNQQQLASKAYMDIRRLSFWNEDADDNRLEFGVARELRYLHASFTYAGLSEVSKTLELSIKIINPDGNLEKAEGSPEGYTFTQNVTVKPGENVINLRGFGSRNAGTFMPGTYRYEVWYKGNKLYSQNFTLADTPGATVLTVDKKTALTVSLDEDGGYRSFSVNTDGDSYDVTLLPSWCSVTDKTETAFTIKYEANNSGSKRKDWFKVSSGEKSVRIDVSQQSSGPSAEIEKVWVDHNYYYDNRKGMMIHVHMSVYDMKGLSGRVSAYFYYGGDSETALVDYNQSYRTEDGKVSVGDDYTATYEASEWKDFWIFMPYDELHLSKGHYELKFQVVIWGNQDQRLADTDWQYFTFTYN